MLTELHPGNDTRVRTGAVSSQDLDGHQVDLLGDTKGLATDGAGNVAAVTLLICVLYPRKVSIYTTRQRDKV